MLYGTTGKDKPPLSPEEKKAEERRQRRKRRKEIILTAIAHTLLLPILLPIFIIGRTYVGVANVIGKILKKKCDRNHEKEERVAATPEDHIARTD